MKQVYKICMFALQITCIRKKKPPCQNLALLTSHIRSSYQRTRGLCEHSLPQSVFIIAWETSSVTRPTRTQILLRYMKTLCGFLEPDLKCGRPVTSAGGFLRNLPTRKHGIIGARCLCHSLFFTFSCYRAHGTCVCTNVPKDVTDFIFWSMLMIILVPLISYFNYCGY